MANKEDFWSKDRYSLLQDVISEDYFTRMNSIYKEKIQKTLEKIWLDTKYTLELSGDPGSCFNKYSEIIFKKNITPMKLRELFASFPNEKDLDLGDPATKEIMENLKKHQLIIALRLDEFETFIITLEGVVFLHSLMYANSYEKGKFNPNNNVIKNMEIELNNIYRAKVMDKLYELAKPTEIKLTNKKYIGFLLFFILNRSIDEKNRLKSKKEEAVNKAINYIAESFKLGHPIEEEDREKINFRVFESDLSIINKNIDYGIQFNSDSEYYLRKNIFPKILEVIAIHAQKKPEEFKISWEALKEEYYKWRELFDSFNDCFFQKDKENQLDRYFYEQKKFDFENFLK